jgi:hypothetical protein
MSTFSRILKVVIAIGSVSLAAYLCVLYNLYFSPSARRLEFLESVRSKISEGRVRKEVIALIGQPDQIYSDTFSGDTTEVWVYSGPFFGEEDFYVFYKKNKTTSKR